MQGFRFVEGEIVVIGGLSVNSIYYAIFSCVHCLSLLFHSLFEGSTMQITCGSPRFDGKKLMNY